MQHFTSQLNHDSLQKHSFGQLAKYSQTQSVYCIFSNIAYKNKTIIFSVSENKHGFK